MFKKHEHIQSVEFTGLKIPQRRKKIFLLGKTVVPEIYVYQLIMRQVVIGCPLWVRCCVIPIATEQICDYTHPRIIKKGFRVF